jgi:hypothetical protein
LYDAGMSPDKDEIQIEIDLKYYISDLNFATINRKSNNSPQLFEIMISHKTKLTKAEFWQLADRASDVTYELIKGEAMPKMSPKYFYSRVTLRLSRILEDCLGRNGLVGVEWAFDLAEDSTPVPCSN